MKPFPSIRKVSALAFVAAALAASFVWTSFAPTPAQAATPNVAVGAGQVGVITLHVSGQYTTSLTAVSRFAMPFPARVLGVGASARASGGTSPTLTVDLKSGGTTMLSAPFAVTAGAYSEGTLTVNTVPDENAITVDFAITGTSPTWNDITIIITYARR
jgi:hypothetical protein